MQTTVDRKKRFLRLFSGIIIVIAAGLCYAAFVSMTGLGLPCVFRLITGLECPGCGVSRMCLSLMRLDFAGAWHANPAIMSLLPAGGIIAVRMGIRYVKTGSSQPDKWETAALIVMTAVLVVFGVVRNIV